MLIDVENDGMCALELKETINQSKVMDRGVIKPILKKKD